MKFANQIEQFKFFSFMCTVFRQSIIASGYILMKEKLLGVWIFFNWPLESHVTGNHRNAQPNIFLESIIVACINFSNISLKEAKL